MSKIQTDPRLVIDMCEARRVFLGEDNPATYVYPAQLYTAYGTTTSGAFEGDSFSDIENISVELVDGGEPRAVALPAMVTRGIASYIRTARWGELETNCMTFAWQVAGITEDSVVDEATFNELAEVDGLAAGDVLSVGTITNWRGLEFAKVRHMVHWAIYLTDGVALNITGRSGILAATPVKNFSAIYPGTNTYKLTDYTV